MMSEFQDKGLKHACVLQEIEVRFEVVVVTGHPGSQSALVFRGTESQGTHEYDKESHAVER